MPFLFFAFIALGAVVWADAVRRYSNLHRREDNDSN